MLRCVVSLGVLGLAAAPVYAHKMLLTATATDLAVQVEVKYEGGEVVPAGSRVALVDEHGAEIADGVTDETGECRLPRPVPGVYSVTVDDRQGHFQKVILVIRDGETATAATAQRNRLAMAAAGVALIGLVTVGAMRWKRRPPSPS
jgi:hypothetical protein